MKNEGNRRDFLRTAGAALVAASLPTALLGQKDDARPSSSGNNLKQMLVFCGSAESVPSLPGIFGQASWQFQMVADLANPCRGSASISDPYFSEVNSQVKIQSVERGVNDLYIFSGTCSHSRQPDLVGKQVTIKVQVLPYDNCDVALTIEDTPLQIGLLLPAIQKVRDKNNR